MNFRVLILLFVAFSCSNPRKMDSSQKARIEFRSLEDAIKYRGEVEILKLINDSQYENFPKKIFILRELKVLSINGIECDYLIQGSPCVSIVEIPKEITRLSKLQMLLLPGNRIAEVPGFLKDLKSLKVLDLTSNKGVDLSKIGVLTNLEELSLNECNLTALPEGIFQLKQLRVLGLQGNQFDDTTKLELKERLPGCQIIF